MTRGKRPVTQRTAGLSGSDESSPSVTYIAVRENVTEWLEIDGKMVAVSAVKETRMTMEEFQQKQ